MRRADLRAAIEREGRAALVLVTEARGSTPREAGAAMLVTATGAHGTIGGGTVERRAIERARAMLAAATPAHETADFPLGPALDQCCGGHMRLAFAVFAAADLPRLGAARGALALWEGGPVLADAGAGRAVLVYGAGHVGRSLIRALAPLPFRVRWIDDRPGAFPDDAPEGVETVATPLPEAEAGAAPAGALHVVLTHSHALDLEIVAAVMERGGFGFLGLIGSATKKATFLRRLGRRGISERRLARLVCPIGVPGLGDKRPEVIAASTAAQLLQADAAAASRETRETA